MKIKNNNYKCCFSLAFSFFLLNFLNLLYFLQFVGHVLQRCSIPFPQVFEINHTNLLKFLRFKYLPKVAPGFKGLKRVSTLFEIKKNVPYLYWYLFSEYTSVLYTFRYLCVCVYYMYDKNLLLFYKNCLLFDGRFCGWCVEFCKISLLLLSN